MSFPFPVIPGCHLESGWLLIAHCVLFTWPLKAHPYCSVRQPQLQQDTPALVPQGSSLCPYVLLAWPQEQTQASPSSHFQGHLSSPGCPRAVGRSTSARLPPLPYSLLPFLNKNQTLIFSPRPSSDDMTLPKQAVTQSYYPP